MTDVEKIVENTKATIASSTKLSRELSEFIERGQATQRAIDAELAKYRESDGADHEEATS